MPKINFQRKTTVIIAVILAVILSYYLGLGRFTNKYITFITNPLIKAISHTSSSLADFVYPYLNLKEIQTENQKIRNKFIQLAQENTELKFLQQENEWLKKELEFIDEYKYNYVIANVLGRGLDYEDNHILIDKGLSSGLKEGLAVTTNQGVVIGKIDKVEDNLSHIKFLIDNQSKLAVTVMAERPVLGLACGQHNINLKIDMLPKDIEIQADNLVVTSGLETNIPAGLIVGYIAKAVSNQEKFWQEALVEPAVDYKNVRMVTIILPENN